MSVDQTGDTRVLDSIDDLTPDEIAGLGRAMARLVMSAWLADQEEERDRADDARR